MANEIPATLPLPAARCLTKMQAAEYLAIGVTLLTELGPCPVKLGRRTVYDRVDLDNWLDDYKRRGRASKEDIWPEKKVSTDAKIHRIGGSTRSSRMDAEYVKALGVSAGMMRKST